MYDANHRARYWNKMLEVYGIKAVDDMVSKSRSLAKFTRFEIGEIISEYELKTKALRS